MSGHHALVRLTGLLRDHGLSNDQVRDCLIAVDAVVDEAITAERGRCASIAKHFQRGADASQAILSRKSQ